MKILNVLQVHSYDNFMEFIANFYDRRVVLYHLFESRHCLFMWWKHGIVMLQICPSIAYNGAIKRIWGLNLWDSNHDACEAVGVENFRHLNSQRLKRFIYRLFTSRSPCTVQMCYYFRFISHISNNVKKNSGSITNWEIFIGILCALSLREYNLLKNMNHDCLRLEMFNVLLRWFILGYKPCFFCVSFCMC